MRSELKKLWRGEVSEELETVEESSDRSEDTVGLLKDEKIV
jgi:hypothetical protein